MAYQPNEQGGYLSNTNESVIVSILQKKKIGTEFPKISRFSTQILRHMHGVLNIDENKN